MSILNHNAEQKFEELYSAYVDEIYQYIYLRTGLQKTVAEDITQEIFISVYKSFSSYKREFVPNAHGFIKLRRIN